MTPSNNIIIICKTPSMGSGDVILDISDYIEPDALVQRKRKGRATKAIEEFKEYLEDSQPMNGLKVEVILDEGTSPVSERETKEKIVGGEDDSILIQMEKAEAKETEVEEDTKDSLEDETIREDPIMELNLDDKTTFGEVEEADVLVAKETESSGVYENNTRLFNILLSQFRRNPSLAGIKSIELQLGQDQVVEPVAVRRLIAQVQNVIEVHEANPPSSNPVFEEFFDKKSSCLSTSLFKPLIYDAKTIYTSHVSANTELDNTVRYEQKADILNDLFENFKHPPVHRGKKPYNTSALYNTVRKAYVGKENTSFDVFETHTPVSNYTKHPDGSLHPGLTPIFSTEHDAQRCVSSVRPERYLDMTSTFSAYRVSENVDIKTLEGTDTEFAIEKREVSFPVLQPQFNEDDDTIALKSIMTGESVSIIGFVVDHNRTLDSENVVHVNHDQEEIEKLVKSDKQFIVLCPDQLTEVLRILAPPSFEVLMREDKKFRSCFNFESANGLLSPYKLDIDSVDRATITNIRSIITRNIIDLIDYVATIHSKNTKKPCRVPTEERHLKFFSHIPKAMLETLGLTNPEGQDDLEFLSKIKTTEGVEQLCCLVIAAQYYDDMAGLRDELESLIDRAKAFKTSEEPIEHLSFLEVIEFIQDPQRNLKKTNKNKHTKTVQRRIEYLQELSILLEEISVTGWQDTINKVVKRVEFMSRRKKHGRSLQSRMPDSKTIEDFSLSLNEERDENANDSDPSGKYVSEYSPNVLPTYFLSAELRNKLVADSSIRLQTHFTARPLLLIARQINTMLHPNKLNCSMSIQEIKTMVYDISEMCDESFSFFERRSFIQELVMSNGMERQEAFGEWKTLVGGDLDVKTQKRVSVVLARLILQLELHRPVHSFRKIFPIGGQKSIGKDSQSSFESYTADNKVKYMVTVAAQTADLGKEGRLMNDYQASDLKNILAYTTSYYDKFLRKPSLIAMKAAADKADQIQTTLLTEKTKTQIPYGYELVQSEDKLKPLLDRLETYNVSLQSLTHRLETRGDDFAELIAVQCALRKKMSFLVVSFLASIQRQIDELDESEWNNLTTSSYNPEKYGDEKSTACQLGEVCILVTFVNLRDIRPQIREDLRKCEMILRKLRARLHFVRFPRRHTLPTYDFKRLDPTQMRTPVNVLRKGIKVTPVPSPFQSIHKTDVSVLDNLVDLLASKTGKDEHWRIAFSAKLSDLGKTSQSIRTDLSSVPRVPDSNLINSSALPLLKQFYRTLRKDISLLSNHLYVTVNSYEMVKETDSGKGEYQLGNRSNLPGDTMEIITARGTLYQMKKVPQLESRIYVDEKRQEWDVLYYNREDTFLTKYIGIARLLEGYKTAEDLSSIIAILPENSIESIESMQEAMVVLLVSELFNCCSYVLRKNPDAIEIANFSIDFLKRCFKQQDDIDINEDKLRNMQNRSYEKYLKEIAEQSKEKSEELWTFRKVGINVEHMDDVVDEDQSAWITSTAAMDNVDDSAEADVDDIDYEESRDDFDIVDDENKMNLFNDDE